MTIITHPDPSDTLQAIASEWRAIGCLVSIHTITSLANGISQEWLAEWCEAV